ncbi:hypothetical protein [Ralstonia pseudosolanacearum]|uniref:hypothetical protein n=1 Tax=Ralstonia pseudosolanacearum TaxID=1310165 RepID=UPI0012DA3C98|nr:MULTISPECIES: hypothetical protein [Ralstonia]MDC6296090.1 hypothetical protein [Ralstonia pseudosolanacearum]MDO3544785.1 hypothetical protein [Ralstonia pseudosolanacearum]UZF36902.1 hypothetical protein LGV81_22220 [Ralstonia sp. RS647]
MQHTQVTGTQAGGTQGAVIAPMRECGLVNCGGYGKALLNPVKRQCGFRCAHHQYVHALRQDEIGNQALDRRFRKKYRVAANATHAGNPMSEIGLKKTAESAWNHCCPLQLSGGCGTILYALCAVCIAGPIPAC